MSGALPIGTVTFLFTDVEGSTRLLEELGAADYAVELGRHREIVRRALAEYGGVEVDTQGDAFFCAFGSARAAVACAAGIQDALAAGPVRVRTGVHTGEALVVDRHYVGMDVHRAARIGACGHGGQVVISPATVGLLEPSEFSLRDLGAHRLKDLAAPVVLHQLGDEDFPPLKALFRTNLPVPATPFLGREVDLRELAAAAAEPGVRLLTLTGPGGTGKTRLALQAAAELSDSYPDGIWWVPLAPLRDGSLVSSAVANVLEIEDEPGRKLMDSIAGVLRHTRVLLLVDNCEHLVEDVATLLGALISQCSDLFVLATSREPLALSGETVFPVRSLVAHDALELFFTRARAAGARLDSVESAPVVTELCARLDNLPLAVELAAARASALPPGALLERLSSGLDVLKGPRDVEERQRTLRATIAWSHGLLEEPERLVFQRLGAFVGGASLAAIEDVCEADLEDVLSLVAKSLVRQLQQDTDEPRYWMLETIREFAFEELISSGELEDVRRRHLDWFVSLAENANLGVDGPSSGAHLERIERDLANLRAAMACAFETDREDAAMTLGTAIANRHLLRGRYSEAEELLRQGLELDPGPLQAALLHDTLARVLRLQGRPSEALESFEDGERVLELVVARDDAWWERWIDLRIDQATFFYFENNQEQLLNRVGELEPLIEEYGTPVQRLELLHLRGQLAYRRERYALSEETEELVRETYRRALELDDPGADFTLGFCLLWRGKPDEAADHLLRGRDVNRARGRALLETRCLVYGALARRLLNDVEGARATVLELDQQEELHGYRGLTAAVAAWVAYRDGDLEATRIRAEEALADWAPHGRGGSGVFAWTARFPLLGVELEQGRREAAREHARSMLEPTQQPLPETIAVALERSVETGREEDLRAALDVARLRGYA